MTTNTTFKHNPTLSVIGTEELLYGSVFDTDKLESKDPSVEKASGFLEEAKDQMDARAKLRDTPGGERTAKKIADVFNAITGSNITEEDAWTFLIVLKMVRAQSGKYNRDDYVDMAAYASLAGETASKRKGQ